jgi:hypothetical protein
MGQLGGKCFDAVIETVNFGIWECLVKFEIAACMITIIFRSIKEANL